MRSYLSTATLAFILLSILGLALGQATPAAPSRAPAQASTPATPSQPPARAPAPAPAPSAINPTDPQCIEYARTANLATIGANSTYRSAFLQASRVGTMSNSLMLNAAVAKIPKLQMDPALNAACGNLTALAISEAASNFTQGIVAQFQGLKGNPQAIVAGPIVPACVGAILLIQFTVFWFAE